MSPRLGLVVVSSREAVEEEVDVDHKSSATATAASAEAVDRSCSRPNE
jgi:hypothetical protein